MTSFGGCDRRSSRLVAALSSSRSPFTTATFAIRTLSENAPSPPVRWYAACDGTERDSNHPPDSKGARPMAYVVCEPCHDCKYTDCVTVCPVDCFYQDEKMLYIDPADCLDCEACVPECPVEAIFHEAAVPDPWAQYVQLNAERATALKHSGGNITHKQEPKIGPGCRAHAGARSAGVTPT
jgi:ferredoxin